MRLIAPEGDTLAKLQPNEFAGERLLAGLSLKCRSRPEAAIHETYLFVCFQLNYQIDA